LGGNEGRGVEVAGKGPLGPIVKTTLEGEKDIVALDIRVLKRGQESLCCQGVGILDGWEILKL